MRIGMTERGDAGLDMGWVCKLHGLAAAKRVIGTAIDIGLLPGMRVRVSVFDQYKHVVARFKNAGIRAAIFVATAIGAGSGRICRPDETVLPHQGPGAIPGPCFFAQI